MGSGQRVLVVDGIEETQEVLKAVLEPRGVTVNRTDGWTAGQDGSNTSADVVVLDADRESVSLQADAMGSARVLIGSMEVSDTSEHSTQRYLQKPFHYGELVRAIENLLARPVAPATEG